MTSKPSSLHPRNPHQGRYDFARLCGAKPVLSGFLRDNPKGDRSIDFSDATAVRCLNAAILAAFYEVQWDLPEGYLCPPIPGRADYIHYLADVLEASGKGPSEKGQVRVLDIGTGANCIYPILGHCSYDWSFVASDIDPASVAAATSIVESNAKLKGAIELRLQGDKAAIFRNIVAKGEHFDLSMCNPPFHSSAEEASRANRRKQHNLHGKTVRGSAARNFSGTHEELWCKGGEIAFLRKMARESVEFQTQIGVFSSLLSKADNVAPVKKYLAKLGANNIEVIEMRQGQKVSRLMVWRFD